MNYLFINIKCKKDQEGNKCWKLGYVKENEDFEIINEGIIDINTENSDEINLLLNEIGIKIVGFDVGQDKIDLDEACKEQGIKRYEYKAIDLCKMYQMIFKKSNKSDMEHMTNKISKFYHFEEANTDTINGIVLRIREIFNALMMDNSLNFQSFEKRPDNLCYCDANEEAQKYYKLMEIEKQEQNAFYSMELNQKSKYLFFDIECSNVYNGNGKICEFSYYITDTKFKVIDKKEIICNPGKKHNNNFKLLGRANSKDIHLQFEADNYKKYRESQEFDAFIPEIKELLMQKDMLIFGWAVDNDLIYVDYSFNRYNKNALNLNAIDIQRFYLDEKGKAKSLEDEYNKIYSKDESNSNKFHSALYDAKCTMLLAKELEKIKHESIKNLITSKGVNCFHNTNCIKNRLKLKKDSNFDIELKIYFDECKKNDEKYNKTIEPFSTDEYIKIVESNESNKNKFLISQMLRKKPLEAIDVINEFVKKGYYFTSLISEADVIIGLSKYDIEHLKLVIDKIQVKTGEKDVLLLTKCDYMNYLNK
ncbi:MAG: hypothetical protein WCR33_02150 [Bacilli bacterium]